MRNIFKKSILFIATCLLASTLWAQVQSFTAAEIQSGTSKGSVTVSTTFSVANKQMCKEGSSSVKIDVIEGKNTANNVDEKYVQITSTTDISKLVLHATYNSSGSGKNMAFVYWGDGVTPAINNVLSATLVSFTGYAGACDKNYSEVTLPSGVRTIRIYRQLKKFDGTGAASTNYGDGTTFFIADIDVTSGPAGPVAVSGVSLNKTTTSIEAGQSEQLTATVSPAGADNPSVTWASDNTSVATVDQNGNVSALAPGTATITVTTTDGNKTATCTVTVTAPPAPIDVQSISMKSATTIGIGASETLTVTYNPADANTNKALSWSSNNTSVATVDANGKVTGVAAGTATITATTANGKTATCSVTVQAVAVTGVSLNKTSASLQIGESETLTATVTPADATNKNISWTSSNTTVATVDNNGKVTAKAAGNTTITVTTVDGNKTATCSVTVTAGPPVPPTSLTTHVPEIYEEKEIAGGYNGTLSVVNGREYEVYYASFTEEGELSVTVTPVQKSNGITTPLSDYHCKANDGWLEMETSTSKSNYTMPAIEEFAAGSSAVHKLLNNAYYKMHIKGFDQFSFYGKDNNADASKGKHFEVYVDGMLQPMTLASSAKIRRFDISTGEHVIEVRGIGGSNNEFYGFSLRAAQEPRTKWLKGNDSTQTVLQTTTIKPVTYVTKYNNIPGAETKLEWIGTPATGISLEKTPGSLSDTLVIKGQANCAVGTYNYAIVAYYNGVETSRATGKFKVASDIQATSSVIVNTYQNEEMDQITFNYYALSANDVKLSWTNTQPAGITGSGKNGKYIIGGTPTATGTYPFEITVLGADTVIKGQITVKELNYGTNPVLYLYKNELAYERDGVYNYMTGKGKNLITRKTKTDGLRPADQYAKYKWIIISEDADADNQEVLAIIRGGANLPVLNLKGFTYTSDRLGWGEPDNGAIDSTATKDKGCNIWIEQPNHPIFKKMTNVSKNAKVKILSGYARNGVMPIAINNAQGTLCLATGMTRSIDDYYAEGELQTAIHEVPAGMRGGYKYICLPVAREVQLSTQGQKLIDGIEDYLLSNAASGITPPTLEIQKFSISDIDANIDQAENTITLRLTEEKYSQLDSLRSVTPKITLADQYTHVLPSPDEKLDLRYTYVIPKTFVVTDYISRRTYDFMIDLYDPYESIDQVYEAGQWVNIFDIYGRKVATTNEDIYSMILPRGMYIVVTESGKTLKIMK